MIFFNSFGGVLVGWVGWWVEVWVGRGVSGWRYKCECEGWVGIYFTVAVEDFVVYKSIRGRWYLVLLILLAT